MKLFQKVLVALLSTVVVSCASTKQENKSPSIHGFWIGEFTIEAENTLPAQIGEKFKLAIWINKGTPTILQGSGDTLNAVDDREFILDEQNGSMVIYSIVSGEGKNGSWVETWTISTSDQYDGTLEASWVRQVNNLDMPTTNHNKQFSTIAFGTLKKVPGFKLRNE